MCFYRIVSSFTSFVSCSCRRCILILSICIFNASFHRGITPFIFIFIFLSVSAIGIVVSFCMFLFIISVVGVGVGVGTTSFDISISISIRCILIFGICSPIFSFYRVITSSIFFVIVVSTTSFVICIRIFCRRCILMFGICSFRVVTSCIFVLLVVIVSSIINSNNSIFFIFRFCGSIIGSYRAISTFIAPPIFIIVNFINGEDGPFCRWIRSRSHRTCRNIRYRNTRVYVRVRIRIRMFLPLALIVLSRYNATVRTPTRSAVILAAIGTSHGQEYH